MKQDLTILRLLGLFLMLALKTAAQPNFINKLPIPPLIDIPANGTIELEMRPSFHKFSPNRNSNVFNGYLPSKGIPTFCYNQKGDNTMTILAPTLKWHSGDSINIRVTNLLGDSTTTHWHGAEVPALYDGGPHQTIAPNATWQPRFRVLDNPSTLWYHPHFHDKTLPQVAMGLSGMIIVEQDNDPIRAKLPQTYGVDDIPVILSDIGFDTITTKNVSVIALGKAQRPYNIVNGVNSPYVEVPRHVVRFRVLNGSTRKGIAYGFRTSQNPNDTLIPFKQIATDGGYTLATKSRKWIQTGPGQRDEVIIDLSKFPNAKNLYLVNLKANMDSSIIGSAMKTPGKKTPKDSTIGNAFLQLNLVEINDPNYKPVTDFSGFTKDWESDLKDASGAYYRPIKKLEGKNNGSGFNIDGHTYHLTHIDDIVCENTKEVWTIQNNSPIAHPFHIHKIQFRTLSVIDKNNRKLNLDSLGLNGPKDDILILPGWTVQFLGNFYDYGYAGSEKDTMAMLMNTYMYHCHILTHEDIDGGGMMHQFIVKRDPCKPIVSTHNHASTTQRLSLYPNPTSGDFYLRSFSDTPSTLTIYDALGRIVKEQTLPPFYSDLMIDSNGLPKGLLFVNWQTEHGRAVGKILIEK